MLFSHRNGRVMEGVVLQERMDWPCAGTYLSTRLSPLDTPHIRDQEIGTWKDIFMDCFLWKDRHNNGMISPIFQQSNSEGFLQIHGCGNASRFQEELQSPGLQHSAWQIVDIDGSGKLTPIHFRAVCLENQMMENNMDSVHQIDQEEEHEEQWDSGCESAKYVALLTSSAKQKDLIRGSKLHVDIVEKGLLEKNVFIGSALVNMYAKCNALAEAQDVFDKLPVRNVVLWNALIAGYTQNGHGVKALAQFEQMQHEGLSPDPVTLVCALNACSITGAPIQGQEMHARVVREGLVDKNLLVSNALIDMYSKCGWLEKAQEVFDELPVRDVVSWNALVAGYTLHRRATEALCCFERMQAAAFPPDAVTYVCILKACGTIVDTHKGQEIHAELLIDGVACNNMVVGTALVDMYASCGMLADALSVFQELSARNVVVWTALIVGYAQHGHVEEAFNWYKQMQQDGLSPDPVAYACILKACGSVGAACQGQEIHLEIIRDGFPDQDMSINTALLDMYASCGMLAEAREVFDELPHHSLVCWTALITGYVQHGHYEEALTCTKQLQVEGISPDALTFACILKACGSMESLEKGQEIHTEIVKDNLRNNDNMVASALVDMYAKCGRLDEAREVFDDFTDRDLVSWSTLVMGYAQHGHSEDALECYKQMQSDGFSPDGVTFTSVLKACGSIEAASQGKEIHANILKFGLLEKDGVVGTAVIDMYAKCGLLSEAQEVFNKLPHRDVVSWSALIAGYTLHEYSEEALSCFEKMQLEGFSPNAITYLGILKACGSIGSRIRCQKLHAGILRDGLMEEDVIIGAALVDMYTSCGMLSAAQKVFDKLPVRSVVTWNILIAGYALLGQEEIVFNALEKLIGEGKEPDLATLTIVLNMCSHRGLVSKGQMFFATMSSCFAIIPCLEHYTCIVDLFGRSDHLTKAISVIEEMSVQADLMVWHTVLGACQKSGSTSLGQWAFDRAAQSNEKDGAAYVSLSNLLYTRWQEKES